MDKETGELKIQISCDNMRLKKSLDRKWLADFLHDTIMKAPQTVIDDWANDDHADTVFEYKVTIDGYIKQ